MDVAAGSFDVGGQVSVEVPPESTDCESTGIGIGTLDVQSSVLLSTDVTGEWSWSLVLDTFVYGQNDVYEILH